MASLRWAACLALLSLASAVQKPHIVYFLVDDLGFSNVGYNNRPNPEPLTPRIDALHDEGAELTNYYVYRFCSPTRPVLRALLYA